MSLLDVWLTDTASMQRVTVQLDPYGNAAEDWAHAAASSFRCRYIERQTHVIHSERIELIVDAQYGLVCWPGTDITEHDRVNLITRQDGSTVTRRFIVKSTQTNVGQFGMSYMAVGLEAAN